MRDQIITETAYKCKVCGLRSSNYDIILSHALAKEQIKPPLEIWDEVQIKEPQGDVVYSRITDLFVFPEVDFLNHYHVWFLRLDSEVNIIGGKSRIIPLEMVSDPNPINGIENYSWYEAYKVKINVIDWPHLGDEKFKMIFKEY